VPKPPTRFYHLRELANETACPAAGQANAPDNFFDSFYLVSLNGESKDYIYELGGSVCLAGSFVEKGVKVDDNPCNAGFKLRNWSRGSRVLEFVIYSHAIQRYKNVSDVAGLARCTLAYRLS